MRRGNVLLLAGLCAGAVVAILVAAATLRAPGPAAFGPPLVTTAPPAMTAPPVTTLVATTASSLPPDRAGAG
jgi:hypothetical protein